MRFATIGALALLAASAAQAQEERPQGWMTRFDREGVTEANLERFVSMAPGWHISTGRGAGIFYDPSMTASSEYTLTSTVFLFDPGRRHREAYGVFFGAARQRLPACLSRCTAGCLSASHRSRPS